jgi:hypothetical protein
LSDNPNGEKKMLKEWLTRVEGKLDCVIKSDAEKAWHGPAIRGLIGVLTVLTVAVLVHIIAGVG